MPDFLLQTANYFLPRNRQKTREKREEEEEEREESGEERMERGELTRQSHSTHTHGEYLYM